MIKTAASPGALDDALLRAYRSSASTCYDEMLTADGMLRPHWRGIVAEIAALSENERQTRATRLDRRVRETGIAYDIFRRL